MDPWVGMIPWRRAWQPTPVFWPGEFHGLYSPWGRKESDTTKPLSLLSSFLSYLDGLLQHPFWLFCISSSWAWFWSLPHVQCYKPLSIVLQALCLLDLIPWLYFSPPLQNHKGIWFRSYLNGLVVFPTFFNLSLNLAIRSSWSEPQSAPSLVFPDCIVLLHLWLQRI